VMASTDRGWFMHCLPVRRNVVVTDGVLDGPQNAAIDEAENRLHVQKAVLASILQ
jgi:N-acetylornithine carbamoyltransferase